MRIKILLSLSVLFMSCGSSSKTQTDESLTMTRTLIKVQNATLDAFYRYENDEVICYRFPAEGVSCNFK